jgi:nicotinate-nucleotide adenylyltransferase
MDRRRVERPGVTGVHARRGTTVPAPVRPGSIGIMGGTYDPIHVGHLAIADDVRETLGLERVLFVPASIPPHKAAYASVADRVAMVALAVAGNSRFEVSRIEVDRPGPSYTADTVEQLAAAERDAGRVPDLTLVLSAETFGELPTWHEPERLFAAARIAVVPREGYPAPDRGWLAERFPGCESLVDIVDGPRLGISSTGIRERVAAGRSIRYLVPAEVARYIADHRLYAAWRTPRS